MAYNYSGTYPGSRYNDLYEKYPEQKPFNPVDEIGPGLDTLNARPPIRSAIPAPQQANVGTQPQAATSTPGTGSPELAGLVHSIQTPVTSTVTPTAPPPVPAPVTTVPAAVTPAPAPAVSGIPAYLQPLINAIPGLAAPMTMESPEMVALANQLTRTNQRGTDIAAEQLREKMAGATGGLVAPGESGLADTALGSIYRGGATDTATQLGKMAQTLPGLNLSRILAGGQLGGTLADIDLSQQQFGYGQEMDALNYLMNFYGAEQGYQQNAWSPYYSGIVNAYGG